MEIRFETRDQVSLHGYWYKARNARGAVLVNPGTATRTLFYKPFCDFLVANGYHVLLWNYRGFCDSRSGSLKGLDYRYSDIGRLDIPAAISAARARFPAELPLYCVGHSAGGQQFGFADNSHDVRGLIAVAVSAGYFSYMPLPYRLKARFFFRVFAPLSSQLLGYVAASRFGFMEDLTSALAREWDNWCREPDLFFAPQFHGRELDISRFSALSMPIHVITASDDEICTDANIRNYWKHVHSQHSVSFSRYPAEASPLGKIGHFGYFKRANHYLWQDIVRQLDQWQESRTSPA